MAKIIINEATGKLNKALLAEKLAARTGVTAPVAMEMIENTFDIIALHVSMGHEVSITNFMSWHPTVRKAHYARNPQTGERVMVPEKRKVKFTASPRWIEYMNSDDPSATTTKKNPKGPVTKK